MRREILAAACALLARPSDVCPQPLLPHDTSRGGGIFGPTVTIDPGFPYYQSRPLAEIARAIRERGFSTVRVVRTGATEATEERAFTGAFRAAGLEPVLEIFPGTDVDLYEQHPEWRQRMLGGADGRFDWRVYLCPNQPGFLPAYQHRIADLLRNGGYRGIQIAEIWYEQWGGPEESPGVPRAGYACLCDGCVAEFEALAQVDPRTLFDPHDSHYYRLPENHELYRRWVDFRVDTMMEFGHAIVDAARGVDPEMVINLMYLSDATVELDGVREYQGCDLERMVSELHPDILTIQDSWQDWTQADLDPSYLQVYADAYLPRIHAIDAGLFTMTHADIGSLPESRRSPEWIQRFCQATVDCGFEAPSFYEWSISSLTSSEDQADSITAEETSP